MSDTKSTNEEIETAFLLEAIAETKAFSALIAELNAALETVLEAKDGHA